jgi:hypothetical protein
VPNVRIEFPPPNFTVPDGQPLHVAGVATASGAEHPPVAAVRVHVDGGAPVDASTHVVLHQPVPTVTFAASVDVPDQPGIHTVSVVVTDENNGHATASVQVLRDTTVVVPAPAIVIDLEPPLPTSADDPFVQGLVSSVQQTLADAAARLASAGLVLAGPNVVASTDGAGIAILRLGIWLVDPVFPVLPPAPPQFPLPRLSSVDAQAGFALVAPLRRGHRVGFTDTPFGVRVPQTTLQRLADQGRLEAGNADVESISVTLAEPDRASTVVTGSHLGVGFSIEVTETLSVAPLVGADPPQSLPHVHSEYSTSVGDLLDWLLGELVPILGGMLLWGSVELAQNADDVPGVVAALLSGLPARVPLRNTSLPPQTRAQFDFPQVVLDWAAFGVNDQGVEGVGDAILSERDQAGARVTVGGPGSLQVAKGEQDVDTMYRLQLWQIRPDAGRLTWRLHPPVGPDDNGTGDPDVLSQSAAVDLDFVLPLHAKQGNFTISAAAVETCGTDPTKAISTTASKSVTVHAFTEHAGRPATSGRQSATVSRHNHETQAHMP